MAPTCQSLPPLSHTSSCAARRSNGADASRSPHRCVVAVVEADPGFPAVGDAAKSPTTSPELATCLHSRSRSRSSPSRSSARHGPCLSSERSSARFASSTPRIPNPLHPKLLHLSSDLPNPFNPSHDPCFIGNRRFPGRQPLKPSELHSAVELLPPVPILFAQQLKSTLGEPLVLMLSTFLRVRDVSTLVLDHAAVGRTVPPPPYAAGSASAALPPRCARTEVAQPRWCFPRATPPPPGPAAAGPSRAAAASA